MSGICCSTAEHERWKTVTEWWRDQPLIGYTRDRHEGLVAWRNCRRCESTLARHEEVEVMTHEDETFTSCESYGRLAAEMEQRGHLGLAQYFEMRAQEAAVARYEAVCAARERNVGGLVDYHEVPEAVVDSTEDLHLPDPAFEIVTTVVARGEREVRA